MPRRFGPVQGSGVAVIEKDAGGAITPSPFGVTLYVGATEKGIPGELIDCPKQRQFLRKCGSFFEGSELPDSALDFYEHSGGAGRLYVIRVTDGLEVEAGDYVASRHQGTAEQVNRATGADQKLPMLSIVAKNGGRWGGAERVLSFDFTIISDLTETTIDTAETMLENEYAGATLQLLGVTSRSYTVLGNDITGVITVEADSKMASDLALEGATNNVGVLTLDAVTRQTTATGLTAGDRQALSLKWKDGEESQTSLFGLEVYVDGSLVRNYSNLSMDPANKWYVGDVINKDLDNDFIEVTVIHSGSFTADNRPANWFGEYKSYAAGTLTAQIAHVVSVVPATPGDDIGFVNGWDFPLRTVRQRLVITMIDATTFNVATTASRGAEHTDLPIGTVGTDYATTLGLNNRALLDTIPTFTVRVGADAFTTGDVFTIDIDPFAAELVAGAGILDGVVFTDGASQERVLIDSNTVDSITFSNLPATAPTPAAAISTDLASSGVITFPTAGGTIDLICDSVGWTQLVYAAEADIATLVATLNAAALAAGLPNTLFATTVADILDIDLSTVYAGVSGELGADQFFELLTIPAELNIAAQEVTGTKGDSFRVEALKELRDGYDGATPSDADYIAAYNTVTSPINRLFNRNLGLVKIATPGVTATNVQKAGINYADFRNYQYREEIPDNITSETSFVAYTNDTIGRSNYKVNTWPSYGYVINPLGEGTVLQTLTGAIHGREARVAADNLGYHKAAAGIDVTLPRLIELPTGDAEIDLEIIEPQGGNTIVKKKGRFVLWGDNVPSIDPAWRDKHAREYMSHTEHVLQENFDWIVFKLNDPLTRNTLIPVFRTYFNQEFVKRAISGASVDEAAIIKIDDENNTAADVANSDMNADLDLRIVGVVKRFNISIGKQGITESP